MRFKSPLATDSDLLPPNSPEAERGVLVCCLLNVGKIALALKAGVNSRWFYDSRHAEIFKVLSGMALNGGGDSLVAVFGLREAGKLESVGGLAYLDDALVRELRKLRKLISGLLLLELRKLYIVSGVPGAVPKGRRNPQKKEMQ